MGVGGWYDLTNRCDEHFSWPNTGFLIDTKSTRMFGFQKQTKIIIFTHFHVMPMFYTYYDSNLRKQFVRKMGEKMEYKLLL